MTEPHIRIKRIVESDLPSHLKHTLHALAYHCNSREQCWPSYRLLADELSVSRSTVRRHVAQLVELGIVLKAARRHSSNMFILQWRVLTAMSRGRVTAVTHRTYQEPIRRKRKTTWEQCRTCSKWMRSLKKAGEAQCRDCMKLERSATPADVVLLFPESRRA